MILSVKSKMKAITWKIKTKDRPHMQSGIKKEANTIADPKSPCNKIEMTDIPKMMKVYINVEGFFTKGLSLVLNRSAMVIAHVIFKNSPGCKVKLPILIQA